MFSLNSLSLSLSISRCVPFLLILLFFLPRSLSYALLSFFPPILIHLQAGGHCGRAWRRHDPPQEFSRCHRTSPFWLSRSLLLLAMLTAPLPPPVPPPAPPPPPASPSSSSSSLLSPLSPPFAFLLSLLSFSHSLCFLLTSWLPHLMLSSQPLLLACAGGHLEICRFLHACGASLTVELDDGHTVAIGHRERET